MKETGYNKVWLIGAAMYLGRKHHARCYSRVSDMIKSEPSKACMEFLTSAHSTGYMACSIKWKIVVGWISAERWVG